MVTYNLNKFDFKFLYIIVRKMFTITIRNCGYSMYIARNIFSKGIVTSRNISGIYEEKECEHDEIEYLNQQSILHANGISLETYNNLKKNMDMYMSSNNIKKGEKEKKYEGVLL